MAGYMTYATDMALKRQEYHIKLLNQLVDSLQYQLLMQNHDDRERIIAPFNHPSLPLITKTCDMAHKRGFVIERYANG